MGPLVLFVRQQCNTEGSDTDTKVWIADENDHVSHLHPVVTMNKYWKNGVNSIERHELSDFRGCLVLTCRKSYSSHGKTLLHCTHCVAKSLPCLHRSSTPLVIC